jgi:hypothetical protein
MGHNELLIRETLGGDGVANRERGDVEFVRTAP